MAELTTRKTDGSDGGSITVDDALFGVQPNVALLHQVVTAQLAAARAGTQSTKTRAEVRGGGAKPFKQKGTGRARQGTTRAPQWTGGGVALGPKPRSYRQRTPKKMVRAALRSALSDRFAEGRVVVLEGGFGFTEPKTRQAVALLDALDLDGTILVVVDREDEVAIRAFRNLPEAQLLVSDELNAYDVLCHDWILFTEATLPKAKEIDTRSAARSGTAGDGTDEAAGAARSESSEDAADTERASAAPSSEVSSGAASEGSSEGTGAGGEALGEGGSEGSGRASDEAAEGARGGDGGTGPDAGDAAGDTTDTGGDQAGQADDGDEGSQP